MFSVVHATVGAIIGEQTNSIWAAAIGGFGLHFVFDAIPHGDQNLLDDQPTPKRKAIKLIKIASVDLLLTIGLLWWLIDQQIMTNLAPVLVGAFAGILPDIISASALLIPWRPIKKFSEFNYNVHFIWNGFTITIGPGLIVQVITLAILLTFILR